MRLTDLTITEAVNLLRSKEISASELTLALLERIEEIDPKINAFITVTGELAMQQAERADRELMRGGMADGSAPGLIHGVPIALKDLYETEGIRTTAGSKFFASYLPSENAFVVNRLAGAGGILLGKLNMHEIALGVTNVNPHYGACRNPWNPERVSGGSSGGSGAALAAGMCVGSLGSDTGGSIRIPAALCGVVGLKPTYGRSSLRGVFPLSWNLDHAGPMARCVQDAAILLQVTAGYDHHDPSLMDVPVDDYFTSINSGVKSWRVALATDDYFTNKTDPEVSQMVNETASVYKDLGAEIHRVPVPDAGKAAWQNSLKVCP